MGTDIGALADGCKSITPIQLDNTAYQIFNALNSWDWGANEYEILPTTTIKLLASTGIDSA